MSFDGEAISRASSATSSVGMFLQFVGGWSKPSGRGLFMFRSLAVGFTTAAIVGVTFAAIAGCTLGAGAHPFVLGSCLGFVGGTIFDFNGAMGEALLALRDYPRLLQHHIVGNFPLTQYRYMDFEGMNRNQALVGWFQGDWRRRAHLIAGYHTAIPSLLELEARKETAILNEEGNKSDET